MTTLNDAIRLEHKISVYVPSTTDVNHAADNSEIVDNVAERLARANGGSTAERVTGYWISDALGLVKEYPVRVWSFVSSLDDNTIIELIDLVVKLKADLGQESILFEIDGQGYLL